MHARRRLLVLAALGVTQALPCFAQIEQRKIPVVGLLWNDSVKPSPYIATFLTAMRENGYIIDRNLRIEDRVALEGYSPMAENAAALVRAKVDVIVTNGATATVAAAKATKEIPIVAIIGSDPVALGLAASLSRPSGNLTGVTTLSGGLVAKRMELLKELIPGMSRMGVVLASNVANPVNVRDSEAAAGVLGLDVQFRQARAPHDIEGVMAELAKLRVNAVHIMPSTMLASHSNLVVAAVAKHRIPAVYGNERYIDAGGLMVYSPSIRKIYVRVAGYVDRVLKGAPPGELAIEQVSDVDLVVNLRTARALGLKIPQSILVRADRVIE